MLFRSDVAGMVTGEVLGRVSPGEVDVVGAAATLTAPLLVVHGTVDGVVSPAQSGALVAARDAAGQPVAGFPIVVFPSDRALWISGSRRIVTAKPASDGRYRISGLAPGEYYLCALTDLDPNDLYDPAFLDQIVSGAFKLSLAEGEKKTQDLRLGGGV